MCPHSAIAVKAVDDLLTSGRLPHSEYGLIVAVATAHVAKFQDAWNGSVGPAVPLPTTDRIDALFHKEETFSVLPKANDNWRSAWAATIKQRVVDINSRATAGWFNAAPASLSP